VRRCAPVIVVLAAWMLAGPARADVPAGCDPSRPAVAHELGGPPSGARLIPCRYDTGARALEPSLGFTRDGRILYQGWELRSGAPNGAPPHPVVRRSNRDFTRWEDVSPPGATQSLDPYLEVDERTGRAFSVNWLGNGAPNCATIASTDDAGETWLASVAACSGFDGESIGTGPPVTSTPVGYPNLVYYCTGSTPGSSEPATTPICSKSLDGGLTFVPTGEPPFPLADEAAQEDVFGPWAGNPVVGPDGTLYVPKRFVGQPLVAVSRDEGLSWERFQVAANGSAGAANRMAVDARGNLFYAWAGSDHLAYLATSTDHGRTWGAPIPLQPPDVREAALPFPAVRGDRVVVAYLGSTDATGRPPYYTYCNYLLSPCEEGNYKNVSWNGYMTVVDGALSGQPRLQTAMVNPPGRPLLVGGCSADGACKADLDFIDADVGPDGEPFAAFVDDCKLERDFPSAFGQDFGRCSDNLGEGIVGRLVTEAETGPAAELGLPATRRCASRRNFSIRLRAPRGQRLRSALVYVNGRRARVVRGTRLRARVDLRGLPRGVVRVTIVARTLTGRTVRSSRRYRTCVPRPSRATRRR